MAVRETVSKKTDCRSGYNIVADTKGTLLWKSDDQYEKPHIILTSEQVSTEHLSYLDGVIVLIGAGIDGRVWDRKQNFSNKGLKT